MMIKNLIFILAIFLLLSTDVMAMSSCGTSKNGFSNKILYVGGKGTGNYSKIKNAIENASDFDKIFVYNGTYNETLKIDKKIILSGENKFETIINSHGKKDNTITLKSENIVINGFTITGAEAEIRDDAFRAGIKVTKSNNKICNNIIKNNRLGIFGLRVTNLTVVNNSFIDDGITFSPYENEWRFFNKIEYFLHNIQNNTVNGKKLLYLKNKKDLIVSGNIGQLIAVNCNKLKIKDVKLNHTDNGLLLAYCSNCIIENCSCSYNDGVWFFNSNNNHICFNNFSNNYLHGITLDYRSNNNILEKNTFSNNHMMGVMIEYFSKKNKIYYNNFIDNNIGKMTQAYQMQAFRNKFKHNYWSNWIGLKNEKLSFLPKIIMGSPIEKIPLIPIVNFDFFPSKKCF